jgi:CheY-like chemotaxis protein
MQQSVSKPARILVIEDNPADIYLLRHALDRHSEEYELDVLADGEAAIRFIQEQGTPGAELEPCVIVLDVHLPKHDGTAVLEALRQEPSLAGVQVVAWTTAAAPQEEQDLLNLGVRLSTTKPTDLDEWIALAGQILEICREKIQAVLA